MIYKRHYVQFNDLVFDDLDMIDEQDTSVTFKSSDSEYSFQHGSYVPFKQNSMQAEMGSVSFTLYLKMKKLPCDVRKFYPQFAITQLTRPGKLWAVQNNTLIWAYAFLTDYTQASDAKKDTIKIDCDFSLPEGVWHKADKQRTFLAEHDVCEFMDCYHYKEVLPCPTDCCHCGMSGHDCDCCYCWDLQKDMALLYKCDLQEFYERCGHGYHIVYDCAAGEKFFMSDYQSGDYIGQRFCNDCGGIYGLLYSDTEIPTRGIKIRLHGHVKDTEITINGNTNQIEGEYDGILTIYPDGSVYFNEDCDVCEPELQSVTKWVIPSGMDYGWEIHAGNNSLKINPHVDCECDLVCAYIEVDALTI